MFFILSKLLLFLLQPINWVAALLIGGRWTKVPGRKRWLYGSALAISVTATNPLVMNLAYHAWEVPPIPMQAIDPPYDVAIVLGGFSHSKQEPRDRLHLTRSGTRLTHALQLYHEGRVRKILITGGSGQVFGEKRPEALEVETFLDHLNFPREDLLIESDSRNTRENAIFSKALLAETLPNATRLLLLTDGLHMPRAQRCFKKAGLTFTSFATSQRSGPLWPPTPHGLILPNPAGFEAAAALLHEVVGVCVYWLKGYA